MGEGTMLPPVAALDWVTGDDTGASSLAIWAHMVGREPSRRWGEIAYPLDPDDFGRCYRLLARVPEWSPRIGEMAQYGPVWAGLAGAWNDMSALWEAEIGPGADRRHGRAPMLYALMKQIQRDALSTLPPAGAR